MDLNANQATIYISAENLLTEEGDLFQGDIKLTVDQKFELLSGSLRGKSSITSNLWPGGVLVYHIEPSLGKLQT